MPKIAGTPLLVLGYHLNENVEKHQVGEIITDLNQNKLEEYLKTYSEQGYQDIIVALAKLKQEVRDIFRTIHIGEEE
jgi:gluconate kinase